MLASILMGSLRLFRHLMGLGRMICDSIEDEFPKIDSPHLYDVLMEGLPWNTLVHGDVCITPFKLSVEHYLYRRLEKWTFNIRDDLKVDIPEVVWKEIEEKGVYHAVFAPKWYHPPQEYEGVDLAYRSLWEFDSELGDPTRDRYNVFTQSRISAEDLATNLCDSLRNPLTREEIIDLVENLGNCFLGRAPGYPHHVRPITGVLLAFSRKWERCDFARVILEAHGCHSVFFDSFVKLDVDIDEWVIERVVETMDTHSLALLGEVLLLRDSSMVIVPETLMGVKRDMLVRYTRDVNPTLKMTPTLRRELEREDEGGVVVLRVIPEWIVPEVSV